MTGDEKIRIYSPRGELRLELPATVGSERVMQLGGEDYAELKWSAAEPLTLRIGDHADLCDAWGNVERLYVCAVPAGERNGDTGGWDYSIRLEPGWKLWGNRLCLLHPGGSAEADFRMTAPLQRHLDDIIGPCLSHHGYLWHDMESGEDTAYSFRVDDTVTTESRLMNYSGIDLLAALDGLAGEFECEWWAEGREIIFGRNEQGSIVGVETGDNALSIKPSGRDGKGVTRLYAFGGSENVPPWYRRTLTFTATRAEGEKVWDDGHPLRVDMFRGDVRVADPRAEVTLSGLAYGGGKSFSSMEEGEWNEIMTASHTATLEGGTWRLGLSGWKPWATFSETPRAGSRLKFRLTARWEDGRGSHAKEFSDSYDHFPAADNHGYAYFGRFPDGTVSPSESSAVTFTLEVMLYSMGNGSLRGDARAGSASRGPGGDAMELRTSKYASYDSAEGLTLTRAGGGSISGVKWNAGHAADSGSLPFTLPERAVMNEGDTFMVSGLQRLNIPTSWFRPDEGGVADAIGSNRLRLPGGTGYIDSGDVGSEAEAVEHYETFDEVYPRQRFTVGEVWRAERTADNGDGSVTRNVYWLTDAPEGFSASCIIPGNELRVKYTSGLLNGMTFGAGWHSEGLYESDGEACLEIVANGDFGATLPNGTLHPAAGDSYILLGWADETLTDALVDAAELELLGKATEWQQEHLTEGETYDVTLPAAVAGEGIWRIGKRVRLIEPSLFPKGDFVSRVIAIRYPLDIPWDNPVVTIGEKIPKGRLAGIEEELRGMGSISDFSVGERMPGDIAAVVDADLTNQSDMIVFNALGYIVGGLPETRVRVWVDGAPPEDFTVSVEGDTGGVGFMTEGDTVKVTSADLSMPGKVTAIIRVEVKAGGGVAVRELPFTLLRRRGDSRFQLLPEATAIVVKRDGSMYPASGALGCGVMMSGSGEARELTAEEMEQAGLSVEWRVKDGDWGTGGAEWHSGSVAVQFRLMYLGECIDLETVPVVEDMRELEMVLDYAGDAGLRKGESMDVACSVRYGSEDVTGKVVAWSVERESGDAAADAVWGIGHKGFSGEITLGWEDLGDFGKVRVTFTAWVGFEDGEPTEVSRAIEVV